MIGQHERMAILCEKNSLFINILQYITCSLSSNEFYFSGFGISENHAKLAAVAKFSRKKFM